MISPFCGVVRRWGCVASTHDIWSIRMKWILSGFTDHVLFGGSALLRGLLAGLSCHELDLVGIALDVLDNASRTDDSETLPVA